MILQSGLGFPYRSEVSIILGMVMVTNHLMSSICENTLKGLYTISSFEFPHIIIGFLRIFVKILSPHKVRRFNRGLKYVHKYN